MSRQNKLGSVYSFRTAKRVIMPKTPLIIRAYAKMQHVEHELKKERNAHDSTRKLLEETRKRLTVDGLTGLLNKTAFDNSLGELLNLVGHCLIFDKKICVIHFDADKFKQINDTHGHVTGDYAIMHLARALKKVYSRKADYIARTGGDEFMAVCLISKEEEAYLMASELNDYLSATPVPGLDGSLVKNSDKKAVDIRLSFTTGCLVLSHADVRSGLLEHGGEHAERVKELADVALYRAKGNRGSTIVIDGAGKVMSRPHYPLNRRVISSKQATIS